MPHSLLIESTFCAALKLGQDTGVCGRLHGHTYRVHASVTRDPDARGFVCDGYALLEQLNAVLKPLDHCYLNDIPPFDQTPPSAENLAQWIFEQLEAQLPCDLTLEHVDVSENLQWTVRYRPHATRSA